MQTLETVQTQADVEVHVNEQLHRLNDIVTALEFVKEEITTRQGRDSLMENVRTVMNDDAFFRRIINYIKRYQLQTIINSVSADVKSDISPDLEQYINSIIDARIESALRRNHVIS